MVNVQMLSELEEVIQYKLVPERRETIKEMWWNRLRVRLACFLNLAFPLVSCSKFNRFISRLSIIVMDNLYSTLYIHNYISKN